VVALAYRPYAAPAQQQQAQERPDDALARALRELEEVVRRMREELERAAKALEAEYAKWRQAR